MHELDIPSLRALDEVAGSSTRTLEIGGWRFLLDGLDAVLASRLDRRWGGFLTREPAEAPRIFLRIVRGPREGWLPPPARGERYRIEARREAGRTLVFSYRFALWEDANPGAWRCALADQGHEPTDRVLENAVRCLVSRVAVEDGGFALHAGGVLDESRAYLLAGPSRSGKTTAIALSSPRPSLGDDFAVVLSRESGFFTTAVPFDNAESAPADPDRTLFAVAGIWRLFHASAARIEELDSVRATASLLSCVALPWTFPDLSGRLLEQVGRFVTESRFEHLHFRRASDFWPLLRRSA